MGSNEPIEPTLTKALICMASCGQMTVFFQFQMGDPSTKIIKEKSETSFLIKMDKNIDFFSAPCINSLIVSVFDLSNETTLTFTKIFPN